ncbi:hypothetical protein AB7U96_001255, partial [Campylobacter upsaliensis]
QAMLDLVRSDTHGSTLAYLLEIAKDDVKIQSNLKNMLNLASSNVEKNLKNLNINPREIKHILDEFESGNKAAFKEVESQISKLYDENYRVVLSKGEYENIKEEFRQNGVNLEEMTPFLRDLEANVFNENGVTFTQLNNFRKNLNFYIFNKDKTPNFINTLKKIGENILKNEIDKGIDNIFSQNKAAYESIKELYSTSLKDYATLKSLNESIKNLKLQDSAKSADEVLNSLIKYAKGQGEKGVNNLQKIKDYLGEENNAFLEMQILNKLFKESVVENDRASLRVFDSESFLGRVRELVGENELYERKIGKEFLEELSPSAMPKQISIDEFLNTLENFKNKENFLKHIEKDPKRKDYLNLIEPTLKEPDIAFKKLENGVEKEKFIKKFSDGKDFFYLLATKDNKETILTAFKTDKINTILKEFNADIIPTFIRQGSKGKAAGTTNEGIITQPLFKSKEAREFLELVEGFHKLYKNDASIAKNLVQGTSEKLSTSIATSAEGAIKQKVVKGAFDPIFRLLPDKILFGLFAKQIQGGALRYHLKKALSRSLNYDDFKIKLEKELKRTNFNSNTSRLIDEFMQNLEDFNREKEQFLEAKRAEQARIKEEERARINAIKTAQENAYNAQEANLGNDILEPSSLKEDFGENFAGYKEDREADKFIHSSDFTKGEALPLNSNESIAQKALSADEAISILQSAQAKQVPKELDIEGFLKELESVENKENFISHLSKKEDAKSRLAYLNLVKPTLEEADLILKTKNKNDEPTKEFIKAFQDENKRFFYIVITEQDNEKKLLTAFKTNKLRELKNRIEKARDFGEISFAHRFIKKSPTAENILKQKSLNLTEKLYLKDNDTPLNVEYKIVNKDDIKPSFTLSKTQFRSQKQEDLIKKIKENFNPDLLVNIRGDLKKGNPIITKEGEVISGNHRAAALKELEGENLAKYQNAVKEAFGVELKENEMLVRVADTSEAEIRRFSAASNEGLENNLGEQGVSLFAKYQDKIKALKEAKKPFVADDVYNLKYLVNKALGESSITKENDTSKALFASLAKGRNNTILKALNELEKENLEQVSKVANMFFDNAGAFYNLTHDLDLPKMQNLQNYFSDVLVSAAKADFTRAEDFTRLNEDIRAFLDSGDKNAMFKLSPNLVSDLLAKAMGAGFARFARLENPSASLYEFLNGLKAELIEKGMPDLFSGGKGIKLNERDEFDFAKELILKGQDSEEKFRLYQNLEELKAWSGEQKNTKLNTALKALDEVDESKLSEDQKELLRLFKGEIKSVKIQIKDLKDIYTLNQGSRKEGAKKILIKHYGEEKTGGLSSDELLSLKEVIKKGKINLNSLEIKDDFLRYGYDYEKDGVKLRVVIDEFKDGKKVFDYYSDRNFNHYEQGGYKPDLPTPSEIIPQNAKTSPYPQNADEAVRLETISKQELEQSNPQQSHLSTDESIAQNSQEAKIKEAVKNHNAIYKEILDNDYIFTDERSKIFRKRERELIENLAKDEKVQAFTSQWGYPFKKDGELRGIGLNYKAKVYGKGKHKMMYVDGGGFGSKAFQKKKERLLELEKERLQEAFKADFGIDGFISKYVENDFFETLWRETKAYKGTDYGWGVHPREYYPYYENRIMPSDTITQAKEKLQKEKSSWSVKRQETKGSEDIIFTDKKGKEHTLTKETQKAWLEAFGLKSLEDSYIPNHNEAIKQALEGKEIKLQLGSLKKLVAQGREKYIPQIKEVLDRPEAIMRDDMGEYLFIKHLKDDDYFVNVSFDNGEYLVSISNGIKETRNLNNKLKKGGEFIYQSPNFNFISQKLLQTSQYSANKIDEDIIAQNAKSERAEFESFKDKMKELYTKYEALNPYDKSESQLRIKLLDEEIKPEIKKEFKNIIDKFKGADNKDKILRVIKENKEELSDYLAFNIALRKDICIDGHGEGKVDFYDKSIRDFIKLRENKRWSEIDESKYRALAALENLSNKNTSLYFSFKDLNGKVGEIKTYPRIQDLLFYDLPLGDDLKNAVILSTKDKHLKEKLIEKLKAYIDKKIYADFLEYKIKDLESRNPKNSYFENYKEEKWDEEALKSFKKELEDLRANEKAQKLEAKGSEDIIFTDKKGKEHTLTKETQKAWLEAFNLKSLDEEAIVEIPVDLKERLGKEIKLNKKDFEKLVKNKREKYIPQIKETFKEPEAVFIDENDDLIFAKSFNDKLFFVNVNRDYGEAFKALSLAPKKNNNLLNKLDKSKEILKLDSKLRDYTAQQAFTGVLSASNKSSGEIIPQKPQQKALNLQEIEQSLKARKSQINDEISANDKAFKENLKEVSKVKPILEALKKEWEALEPTIVTWTHTDYSKAKPKKYYKRKPNLSNLWHIEETLDVYKGYARESDRHANQVAREIALLEKYVKSLKDKEAEVKAFKAKAEADENALILESRIISIYNQLREAFKKGHHTTKQILEANNIKQDSVQAKEVIDSIAQTRQYLEDTFNIKPLEEFGTNYAEFYRDGKGAVEKLLKEAEDFKQRGEKGEFKGQVAGAFYKEGLGEIDLVWGDENFGLRHIIDKHGDEFEDIAAELSEAMEKGVLKKQNEVRSRIEFKDFAIGLSGEFKGEKRAFIITAFKRNGKSSTLSPKQDFTDKSDNVLSNQEDIIPQNSEKLPFETQTLDEDKLSGDEVRLLANKIGEKSTMAYFKDYLLKMDKNFHARAKDIIREYYKIEPFRKELENQWENVKEAYKNGEMSLKEFKFLSRYKDEKSFLNQVAGVLWLQNDELVKNRGYTINKYGLTEQGKGDNYYQNLALEYGKAQTALKKWFYYIQKANKQAQRFFNKKELDEFGVNFEGFKGKEAVDKLLSEKRGQVKGAFYKEGLGEIDLVWGDEKIGLKKIIEKHLSDFENFEGKDEAEKMVNALNEIIENGKIITENGINTLWLKKGDEYYLIGLSRGWSGKGENEWIITSYKKTKGKIPDELKGDTANLSAYSDEFNPLLTSKDEPLNSKDIIPQQKIKFAMEKFNYDEKKAKDLLEWHKNSHALTKDENGLPKVFYHGTYSKFRVFRRVGKASQQGFFFTPSQKATEEYGDITLNTFLNIKNPFRADELKINKEADLQKWADILKLDYDKEKYESFKDLKTKLEKVKEATKKAGFEFHSASGGSVYVIDNKGRNSFINLEELDKENKRVVEAFKGLETEDIYFYYVVRNEFDLVLYALNKNDRYFHTSGRDEVKRVLEKLGYDGAVLNDTIITVFNSNQIKHIDNKGSFTDTKGNVTSKKPKDKEAEFSYFNEKSDNIYHSNPHLGAGLVGGTLNGVEQDENGNLSFDPVKFAMGFLGGSVGSFALKKGFQILEKNPELKEKIINELAHTLAQGFEKAREKYSLLNLLEPRYIVKNEKGRKIQAKTMLKELEREQNKNLQNIIRQNLQNLPLNNKPLELSEKQVKLLINRFANARNLKEHLNTRADNRKELYALLNDTLENPQIHFIKEGRDKYVKRYKGDVNEPYFYLLITQDKDKIFITHLKTRDIKYLSRQISNAEQIKKGADIIEALSQRAGDDKASASKKDYSK